MQIYAIFMSVSSFILGYYLLTIGMGWHTPRTKKPLTDIQLEKLRRTAKLATLPLIALGILYGYTALSAAGS